jgi:hypothetical protein
MRARVVADQDVVVDALHSRPVECLDWDHVDDILAHATDRADLEHEPPGADRDPGTAEKRGSLATSGHVGEADLATSYDSDCCPP